MKFSGILAAASEELRAGGPSHPIVVTSRVRFARNIRRCSFPGWSRKADRIATLQLIKPMVEALPEMADGFSENLENMTALEKQVLVERHLVSREHAAKGAGSAVVVNKRQNISIMINEEDHLRMQAIRLGFQLDAAFEAIDQVDSELEESLDYAFSSELGYLTACPTNVGTGMRASAMLHLPALVLKEEINKVIQAVNKIGLAVRGLYGEGTEAMGNLFQISNQTTLGEKESDIIGRLSKVIEQVIQHEENAREVLLQKSPIMLSDQIGRAFGVLTNAYSMTSKEALNLISIIRLGCDIGIFPTTNRLGVDELFMETQPAHLQKGGQQAKLAAEERDGLRAEIIRKKLKSFPQPAMEKMTRIAEPTEEAAKETGKNGSGRAGAGSDSGNKGKSAPKTEPEK